MRAGGSRLWRLATAAAFGATAALAITLSRGAGARTDLTAAGAARAASPAAGCAAQALRVALGPGDRVSAATTRYPVQFANVSRAPCALSGYPRVTAYRGGAQVGAAAVPVVPAAPAAARVVLAPGQAAHAFVEASVPGAPCRPVRASGLRVVAPGQAAPSYLRRTLTACSAPGHGYLRVGTVQPGPAPAGNGPGTLADVRPTSGG